MTDAGQVVEHGPDVCPNGHELGPRQVLVGWRPCNCPGVGSGHRTYTCTECGEIIFRPQHTE